MLQCDTLKRKLKELSIVLSVYNLPLVNKCREEGTDPGLATVQNHELYTYSIVWGHNVVDQVSDS